jgi:hypothetical protein
VSSSAIVVDLMPVRTIEKARPLLLLMCPDHSPEEAGTHATAAASR